MLTTAPLESAAERRADLGVVDGDPRVVAIRRSRGQPGFSARHAGRRAVRARLGLIERRLREEFSGDEILRTLERNRGIAVLRFRLLQDCPGDHHVGARSVELGRDVARVEPRDDLARLHARTFGDAEPFQASRSLGRDRRLALRDDVARGIEHDELLRRIRGDDGRGQDRDRSRLQCEPDTAQGNHDGDAREPQPSASATRLYRRERAVDPEL